MIRCTNVHKSYTLGERTVTALRGVNLNIQEPGFYAIMGQSGSGKSTLLHLLATLDRPDKGEIIIGGDSVHDLSEKDATEFRRRKIGIIFQQFNLIPTLSARENVELPGVLAGESMASLRERSLSLLERLGLQDRQEHRPQALSGGEQQRVAIARALLFGPPLVLADEPTGNLDSATSDRLWGLLGELALEHEITVLMVTHEPTAAMHCKTIHVLQDGKMTGEIQTEGLDAGGVATSYQQFICQA